MRETKIGNSSKRGCTMARLLLLVGFSMLVNLAACSPVWPVFSKRNVQALARDGLLSRTNNFVDYKRSISTLAKNGMLPTFTIPENNNEEENTEDSENENVDKIARLKSYQLKRNTGTLARNGVRAGKRSEDYKRNIGSIARNGYLKTDPFFQKRENSLEDEYYFPFYQNQVPPISDMDYTVDYNELYDLEQSLHPDLLPPISDYYKSNLPRQDPYNTRKGNPEYRHFSNLGDQFDQVNKRVSLGLPNHGLLRVMTPSNQEKRYILSYPDITNGSNQEYSDIPEKFEKKSVGSIPMTRIAELGNISLTPKVTQRPIQTTPTYRRRQYLLTRSLPAEEEVDQ